MNPTFIGLFSIIVWGISVPFMRLIEEQIGALGYGGFLYLGIGILGLSAHLLRRQAWPDKAVLSNPLFYGRWLFFVLHEGFLLVSIFLVQTRHIPFVILICSPSLSHPAVES